jgi:hypothetical protein
MGIHANVADKVVWGGQQPVEECVGVNLHFVTVVEDGMLVSTELSMRR